MQITIKGSAVSVEKEFDNESFRTESAFFYQLKKDLVALGYDVIKKEPAKDGHLTSAPYYIRDRKRRFCIYDDLYALRDIAKAFNTDNGVWLVLDGELTA